MLKYQTRSRGQALVETAVVAPLIVLTLAGTLYAARTAIVRERLQIGARYSGLLLSYGDTYSDFSTYALDSARNGSAAALRVAACRDGERDRSYRRYECGVL